MVPTGTQYRGRQITVLPQTVHSRSAFLIKPICFYLTFFFFLEAWIKLDSKWSRTNRAIFTTIFFFTVLAKVSQICWQLGNFLHWQCKCSGEPRFPQGECGKIVGGHMARMGWGVHHGAYHLLQKAPWDKKRARESEKEDSFLLHLAFPKFRFSLAI